MSYALMIDSTAALPESFIDRDYVKVAEVSVMSGDRLIEDPINQSERAKIFSKGYLKASEGISSIPPTHEKLFEFVMEEVVPFYDTAVFLSLTEHASPIYSTFLEVARAVPKYAREKRNDLGIQAPFRISASHTGTVAAGQGLVTLFADMILAKGTKLVEYTARVEKFRRHIHNFIIIKDFVHGAEVAKQRGVGSTPKAVAMIGQALGAAPISNFKDDTNEILKVQLGYDSAVNKVMQFAEKHIVKGLYLRAVNICYAGELKNVITTKAFKQLKKTADANKVLVLVSVMPLSIAANVGAGAISISFAPRDQHIDF